MTLTKDHNNHPAHAPLAARRLHQMRDILSKASARRDGGDIGYAMSDAVKLIDEVLAGMDAPVMFIDGNISPEDAEKLIAAIEEFNREPRDAQVMIAEPVSEPLKLDGGENCWSCGKYFTYEQHSECDGYCPHCDSPVDLDDEEDQPSKVVPTNPTQEMISNAWREAIGKCDHETIKRIYATMLAAAPDFRENAGTSTKHFREKAETTTNGWIKCSERIPEESTDADGGATCYLVLYADGKEPNGGSNVGVWNVTYLRRWWAGFITHWMPLPAAPQQEVKP